MRSNLVFSLLCSFSLLGVSTAQTASSTSEVSATTTPAATATTASQSQPTATTSSTSAGGSGGSGGSGTTTSAPSYGDNPPDVKLKVPELHVGRIELDVDNVQAEINLAAQVANLVELNAGIQVGIRKVNITISEVDANLDLVIRLGNLVEIVNRTLESLNLNPLLINVLNEATDLVNTVVGEVDGLLGSIVNGDSTVNFLIDNLGNVVQEVSGSAGKLLSSIVGNYEQNMTYTGAQQILDGGLIQKTYKYDPLGSLVNIVFNSVGQVVQAVVVGSNGGGGGSSSSSSSSSTTTTVAPTARR
ncbi:hypothetical protein GGR52DRAFT_23290 [Hypoxylon sp. FL1284]|nr:hypothetical protein GGR52DRAFT_23290 [Hypoxylon sp. FL1284]